MNLLREFVAHGGNRFVVAGSGYEYDWNYGYCSETRTPANPNTVYGSCKRALHLLADSIASEASVRAAWARVFFLYGPGEHPDRLVASVIRALLNNEPAMCSHGRQVRDYLHVADVAEGLVSVLDTDVVGAVNICSGQATSLREIVTEIGHQLERPELVKLGALPARANDVSIVVGDNSRLLSETQWTQRFDLQGGLSDTISWWREHLRQDGKKS
jgi:nucleoside-diphosphate-sugar epimerase